MKRRTGITGLITAEDPDDERNCFLEVRAGTGGDEAALFAGDLFLYVQPLCGITPLAD